MFTPTENYGLTYYERERIAYANGDVELAGFYAGLDDAEQENAYTGAFCEADGVEAEDEETETLEDYCVENTNLHINLRYLNNAFNLLEKQYDELKVKYDALTARLAA